MNTFTKYLFVAIAALLSVVAQGQTFYSNTTNTNFATLTGWSANTNGTGANPASTAALYSATLIIQNGHTKSVGTTAGMTGTGSLTVQSGGIFTIPTGVSFSMASTASFNVNNGGTVNIQTAIAYQNLFAGTENFGASSTFNFSNSNSTTLQTTFSGTNPLTTPFGNVNITTTAITGAGFTTNTATLCTGNFTYNASGGTFTIGGTGIYTATVGGNFTVTAGTVNMGSGSSAGNRSLILSGATAAFSVASGATFTNSFTTSATGLLRYTGANCTFSNAGTFTTTSMNHQVDAGARVTLNSALTLNASRSFTVNGNLVLGTGLFTNSAASPGGILIGSAGRLTFNGGTYSASLSNAITYQAITSELEYGPSFAGTTIPTYSTTNEFVTASGGTFPGSLRINKTMGIATFSPRIINGNFTIGDGTSAVTFTMATSSGFTVNNDILINNNATLTPGSAGAPFITSGNFTNNGTMTAPTAGFLTTFNGTNKNISGSGVINFGAITVSSGVTINLLNNINLYFNTSTISGTLDCAANTISRAGISTPNVTINGRLRTSHPGGFRNTTGTNQTINSNLTINSLPATSFIEFYGANQSVFGNGGSAIYGNIDLTGTGIKTIINGNLDINGSLEINAGVTLDVSSTNNTLSIRDINLAGDYTNLGTFIARTGTFTFDGSSSQFISPNGSSFYNLELANATSDALNLSDNATVTNQLIFTNGRLVLGSFNLTLTTTATISGTPTNLRMVLADDIGQFIKQYNGIQTFTYPVGTNSGTAEYTPVTLNLTANSSTNRPIGVTIRDVQHPNDGTPTNFLARYWIFTESTGGTYTYNTDFVYVSADLTGSTTNMRTNRWNGTTWADYATTWNSSPTRFTTTGLTQATAPLGGSAFTARINPVANDAPCGAVALTPGAAGVTTCTGTSGTVLGATQTFTPCGFSGALDVWYRFVATATSHTVEVDGATSFDAAV